MAMIDVWASPTLVAESAPTGGTIAYQMLAGVTDAVDPVGGLIQRFADALTGVSSVDRSSLGYEAGNQLIGPMLVTVFSIGAGGVSEGAGTAASAEGYDLAIGLADQLPGLVSEMNGAGLRATTYVEQAGTRVFDPGAFMQVAGRARSIHFAGGEPFDFARYASFAGKFATGGEGPGGANLFRSAYQL
jgi:hypothetical protein